MSRREGPPAGLLGGNAADDPGRPRVLLDGDRGRPESTINRPRGSARRCFSYAAPADRLEMLREFLETLIEIFGIDFHMLNASHRIDGQNLSVFHACNLFHHLRAAFHATPLLKNQ